MSKRILCKFFAHGACLKAEQCEFSHDWNDPTNNVCTFYQRGICSYGSRCRYEHVKAASRLHSHGSSSSAVPRSSTASASNSQAYGSVPGISERGLNPLPSTTPVWNMDTRNEEFVDKVNAFKLGTGKPEEKPICPFAAAGECPRGDNCPHMHGDICPTCGKHCLHPFRPREREAHKKECEKLQKHLEALKLSQDIECCVCLERVLSKTSSAERKFGILTECDHAFCIGCIRNWRSTAPSNGMDTVKSCPICRKLSHFVVPSVIWFSAPEEKKEIMDSYREKLRTIDCKHFNFGDGNCPFGLSCFYKHTVRPGTYTWIHHTPPPRPPRGRPYGSNFSDVDALAEMFGNILSEGENGPFGFEDTDNDEMSETDMIMLMMQLDIESEEDSSNEDGF